MTYIKKLKGNYMTLNEIIKSNDFEFKKKFGQNFISDTNLLNSIVSDAEITSSDEVLEIGVGAGTLTKILSNNASKVVGIEIDKELEKIHEITLADTKNVKVIFDDFMSLSSEFINSQFSKPFKVVANLPYYITTPIIFKLLEEDFNIVSLTLMVQKEVAERLISKQGSKDYGAITVQLNSIADVKLKRIVGRQMFSPVPNVDSAIIKIDIDRNKFQIDNFKLHKQLIKVAFSMRRKTLSNCLKSGFGLLASQIEELFNNCSLDLNVRGESLSISQFVMLSNELNKINLNK